jgi:hypothetical protein
LSLGELIEVVTEQKVSLGWGANPICPHLGFGHVMWLLWTDEVGSFGESRGGGENFKNENLTESEKRGGLPASRFLNGLLASWARACECCDVGLCLLKERWHENQKTLFLLKKEKNMSPHLFFFHSVQPLPLPACLPWVLVRVNKAVDVPAACLGHDSTGLNADAFSQLKVNLAPRFAYRVGVL